MKFFKLLSFIIASVLLLCCKKENNFYVDAEKLLEISTDSVSFDTVFTTLGSTTCRVKIFNRSKKDVSVSRIELMGNTASPFKLNINGVSINKLENFKIKRQDSINLFIKVTIDPNAKNQPFIVTDSVQFLTNNKLQQIHLRAFGQNAHFLNNAIVSSSTTWDNKLPYVIYNSVHVNEGATLNIPKGSRIYFHKDAKLEIEGTLLVNGDVKDSVTFASDRLERFPYGDEKGQWVGIRFLKKSKDNVINHATIKNALIGLQIDSVVSISTPKLLLVNSIVKNMEIAAIVGYNTSVTALNNLFTNCGQYLVYCANGGTYNFKQNTLVNLSSRITPSLFFTDKISSDKTAALNVTLINNIIWGNLPDELIVEKKGTQFIQLIRSNLIKSRDQNLEGFGNQVNKDPLFILNSTEFYLQNISPAVNKGENLSSDPYFSQWLSTDQQKKTRIFPSELGCYEL